MKSNINSIKRAIKSQLKKIDILLMKISIKSYMIAAFYYVLRKRFSWEHRAVLAGRKIYNDSLQNPLQNTSLLRRNVHRLEKGLLMKPRRVPFGLDYIEETILAYERAVKSSTELNELIWARDVINEYMDITPSHALVDPLRKIVNDVSMSIEFLDTCNNKKKIPYLRDEKDLPNISYEQFLELAEYRRSVRWFLPKKIERSVINKAASVAAYSPTACNRQPYEFHVFDDDKLVSELIKMPMGSSGFGHQVPHLAVVIGRLRNYVHERDRHCIYIDASLAIMSFIYALEVQGVGSCCLNWPEVPELEQKMADFLNLELDERPIMLIAFGYPDPKGMVANSTKKPLEQIVKYNFDGDIK